MQFNVIGNAKKSVIDALSSSAIPSCKLCSSHC